VNNSVDNEATPPKHPFFNYIRIRK